MAAGHERRDPLAGLSKPVRAVVPRAVLQFVAKESARACWVGQWPSDRQDRARVRLAVLMPPLSLFDALARSVVDAGVHRSNRDLAAELAELDRAGATVIAITEALDALPPLPEVYATCPGLPGAVADGVQVRLHGQPAL